MLGRIGEPKNNITLILMFEKEDKKYNLDNQSLNGSLAHSFTNFPNSLNICPLYSSLKRLINTIILGKIFSIHREDSSYQ